MSGGGGCISYSTEMDKKYKYRFAELIQNHYNNFNILWTPYSNNKTRINSRCEKFNLFGNPTIRYTCKMILANDVGDGKIIDPYGVIIDPNINIDDGRTIQNGEILPISNYHIVTTCDIESNINLYGDIVSINFYNEFNYVKIYLLKLMFDFKDDILDVFYYYNHEELHKRYDMDGMIFCYK